MNKIVLSELSNRVSDLVAGFHPLSVRLKSAFSGLSLQEDWFQRTDHYLIYKDLTNRWEKNKQYGKTNT